MSRKSSSKLLLVVAAALFLSGCFVSLKASINILVEPNPITFKLDETSKDVTVTFKTKGFGSLKLAKLQLVLLDSDEQEITREEVNIDKTINFVVPFIKHQETINVKLPSSLLNDSERINKEYKLQLTLVTDDDPVVTNVELKFVE